MVSPEDIKSRKFKLLVFIIISLILISLINIYLLFGRGEEGITAMEGKEKAEDVVQGWHGDAKLIRVDSLAEDAEEGMSTKWEYVYFSISSTRVSDNYTLYEHIYITIGPEKKTVSSTDWRTIGEKDPVIENWTLDSDKAVDRAKQDKEIKSYVEKYEGADLDMRLVKINSSHYYGIEQTYSATRVLHWSHNAGLIDNPVHAEAYIDAETGEIIYAEADT